VRARALVFVAPRRVEIRPVDVADPRAGEVLVRSLYSGISSGTEMLVYRGLVAPELALDERIGSLSGSFRYPFQYGYSCVGIVEQPTDSVLCGSVVFAYHPHQDLFTVREPDVLSISDTSPRLATLFPLVETALQISLEVEDLGGDPIVVLGLGAVGVLAAALLARRGRAVVGVDVRPWRAAAARDFGVDVATPDDVAAEVGRRSGGQGAAVVVEATGVAKALADSLSLLRHEGTVLVASWYGSRPVPLPLGGDFHRRRLTIRSTQVSTIPAQLASRWTPERRRTAALELLDELPLAALATHEFPFAHAPSAFAAIDRGEASLLHAALSYAD
jgi:2-desacetyl-2-hydroxyethyl bacteriochlorophyllide A dehydrogenase